MQLVAYGAQDVYLTGNPKVTFFQAVYKRHTNFAMECIEQTVNGTVGNTGRVSVTIARNGDLVGCMHLEMKPAADLVFTSTDAVASREWLAERAISDIELSIGGQRVDKHYQKWWRLYSELYLDEAKRLNWAKMTSYSGAATPADTDRVYLPLIFFFNRNPGLYLPLIALQYHEVRLDIDLASNFESYLQTSGFKVWADYIYLDTEERRRFAQKPHEYLIEQVQHTGIDSVTAGAEKQVRLSYNHPVKELVWCFSKGSGNNDMWNTCHPAAGVNMTLAPIPLVTNVAPIYTGSQLADDANLISSSNLANFSILSAVDPHLVGTPQLMVRSIGFADASETANVNGNDADATQGWWYEEGAYTSSKNAVGPLSSFKLILNGQDRFKEQLGKYFNQVQPYNHHSGNPYPGIYSYSFALKPEEHQPTGTCNFSRIDNAQASVTLKSGVANTSLNMFAVNYNVLRIQSGMGGLAFSN